MGVTTFIELQNFKQKANDWLSLELDKITHSPYSLIFSYGDENARCKVWHTTDVDPKQLIKRTLNYLDKLFEKKRSLPQFLKFDIPTNIEEITWADLQQEIQQQEHNNHYRRGISFDPKFNICFLEQEIYAKALIKGIAYDQPNFFDEKNIHDAIRSKYSQIKQNIDLKSLKTVWTFETISVIYENNQFLKLEQGGLANGVRHLSQDLSSEIRQLVQKNAKFLHEQILENGRFVYGYFPAYDREIKSYNTVRHCTAVYALLETLEVDFKKEYLEKIKQSIHYAIETFFKQIDSKGFMIDGNEQDEIKLGSNAAAIFMLAKYQELTQDMQFQTIAERLAEGIQYMVDEQGETTHVMHYPSLEVKEKFRIVYYDGEAALGLLRLYQMNQNSKLLDTVKLMFEHFINKKYDKYHDHWLSYCTNELTKICPEIKYFEFGLNNYLKHMKFIRERKTAYATFLEMMMSAYKMVVRLKEEGFEELFVQAKFEELKDLIKHRVEFQRATGFFYPEAAMYMAKPKHILNAFYVRHDRIRMRIDDQEHNLSGYVAYLLYFES